MKGLHINKQYLNPQWTTDEVQEEIRKGLTVLNNVENDIITVFGSHKSAVDDKFYIHCREVSQTLGERGYAILSGGGPGIMHAANTGATNAGAPSIGFKAMLLDGERITDNIFTFDEEFRFIFVRRFLMSIKSSALVFYPGGYGTLNELFEYAVLIQTGITDKVPLICVGKEYWQGLIEWIENHLLSQDLLMSKEDVNLFTFVDSVEDTVKAVEESIKENS